MARRKWDLASSSRSDPLEHHPQALDREGGPAAVVVHGGMIAEQLLEHRDGPPLVGLCLGRPAEARERGRLGMKAPGQRRPELREEREFGHEPGPAVERRLVGRQRLVRPGRGFAIAGHREQVFQRDDPVATGRVAAEIRTPGSQAAPALGP